jgi:hypothetical protein
MTDRGAAGDRTGLESSDRRCSPRPRASAFVPYAATGNQALGPSGVDLRPGDSRAGAGCSSKLARPNDRRPIQAAHPATIRSATGHRQIVLVVHHAKHVAERVDDRRRDETFAAFRDRLILGGAQGQQSFDGGW